MPAPDSLLDKFFSAVEENDIYVQVMLSMQGALLGAITPNIRLISVDWDGFANFRMMVHYDGPPSEDDIEEMEAVSGEIIAHVPFNHADLVEVVVSDEPLWEVAALRYRVYCRKEKVAEV